MGAYPMLTAHFAAANLDPQANNWDKVLPHNVHLDVSSMPPCMNWAQAVFVL